jgi:hypothetical protein
MFSDIIADNMLGLENQKLTEEEFKKEMLEGVVHYKDWDNYDGFEWDIIIKWIDEHDLDNLKKLRIMLDIPCDWEEDDYWVSTLQEIEMKINILMGK